jgi:hypothetical protein
MGGQVFPKVENPAYQCREYHLSRQYERDPTPSSMKSQPDPSCCPYSGQSKIITLDGDFVMVNLEV